jgi:hypothetical protein
MNLVNELARELKRAPIKYKPIYLTKLALKINIDNEFCTDLSFFANHVRRPAPDLARVFCR